ncbi:type VI secretion system baseplate subunit TssE [Marivibrio halodurans]|uniref:Type VI secretion system baseplate subunit TssE n=1 Tax=Marivibrio halodurans TaxID=2039722 RepID=A0A8J7V129_9PROT|nr:type VI secretion system baseplate subunit TssE [Marivibrio halodurans]MBP5857371.1 type VI secretion system baseplate subunit TssE [Marivibrio halodurans]
MRPLHSTDGARAPLFDRLIDETPSVTAEPIPRIAIDIEALARSIEREVRMLLNTRCPLRESEVDYGARTVIDYGLVDLNAFFTDSVEDKRRLASHVARTIAAYEPRLASVNVTIGGLHRETRVLEVEVSGEMRYGTVTQPIAFPVRIAPPGEEGDEQGEAGETAR